MNTLKVPLSSSLLSSLSSSQYHYNQQSYQNNNYLLTNNFIQPSSSINNSTTNITTLSPIKNGNNLGNSRDSVNRSSIIVSDELVSPLDLTIIIFVLLLWATTILMCINKWGKIRMLEPYQPSFQASDENEFTSTTPATVKKATPVVGNIRFPATSCKSTLNRSTIRIIPSEADLVNMQDSIMIGMGRSLDIGMGNNLGGYCERVNKLRRDYRNLHSFGISNFGRKSDGDEGCGGGSESESINNGMVYGSGSGSGGKVNGEIINIPRIEISPINWSEERKCKSLDDVRVRLLS